jgi:hypothetical protein
MDIGG